MLLHLVIPSMVGDHVKGVRVRAMLWVSGCYWNEETSIK